MPMIGGEDRPSLCKIAPANRPWFDSTRPMAASSGQVIPQDGLAAAAARRYASSAVAGMPPAARTDTVAGSVVPTDGPIVWAGNVTSDRPGRWNGEVGLVRGLMLGGPDESDATDPNDPPDAAKASLDAGRAATVAPDTVAAIAIVIRAAANTR